jgi:aspartate 1-decarboxylase
VNPMRCYVAAKLHGLRVTDKAVHYTGSVSLPEALMEAVGIDPYEQVQIVNLNNGNRWETYALPHPDGRTFALNGGGARLGEIGDECVVMAYRWEPTFSGCKVLFFDDANRITQRETYPPGDLFGNPGTPR